MTATAGSGVPAAAGGGGGLDANTTFLTRFTASPPVDEVSLATGTLAGNATCDTANSRITLDGAGDWCIYTSTSVFDLPGDFTIELYADCAAAEVGGLAGRKPAGNPGRWVMYCAGDGSLGFYADNISGVPLVFAAGVLDGSNKHIAICRESDTWRLYKAGAQVNSSVTAGSIGSASANLYIGTDPFADTSRDVAGHIGRFKISNTCRYPGGTGFTPPAITAV